MRNGEHPGRLEQASDEPSSDRAPAYAELRDLALDAPSIEEFLLELSSMAADIGPGACCGFVLEHDGGALSVAASDDVAAWLDEVQNLDDEGPTLTAMRTGARVDLPSLAEDDRWGEFPSQALAAGIGSGVCLPVIVQEESVGALSLYAPGPRGLSDSDVQRAQWIVDEAAAGLSMALRRSGIVPDDELPRALASRRVIDRALGVLMHARRVPSRAALEILLDLARTSNRSPQDVGLELIEKLTGESGRPADD